MEMIKLTNKHHIGQLRLRPVRVENTPLLVITDSVISHSQPARGHIALLPPTSPVFSTLIGREDHSVATPALLCHKEPARRSGLWMPELVHYGIIGLA